MNNLVTSVSSPLTFIACLQSDCASRFEEGVHIFYDFDDDECLDDRLVTSLYEASSVYLTEHDTTAGGDRDTQEALRIFSVTSTPSLYFLYRGRIYKYYGICEVEAILRNYRRLIDDAHSQR